MDILDIARKGGEPLVDIEDMLDGRVFHVTRRENWPAIEASGALLPNTEGQLTTTFGYPNSFFRRRGCVSVFDYRAPPDDFIRGYRNKCRPVDPAKEGAGVAILIFDRSIEAALLPWTLWKDEAAWSEQVVPYVEAGHPGLLSLSKVARMIFLHIAEDPNSVAAVPKRGRPDRSTS